MRITAKKPLLLSGFFEDEERRFCKEGTKREYYVIYPQSRIYLKKDKYNLSVLIKLYLKDAQLFWPTLKPPKCP